MKLIADQLIDTDELPDVTIEDAATGAALTGTIPDDTDIRIRFDCPMCGDDREVTRTTPLDEYGRAACHTHGATYPLRALTIPPRFDDTLENRVRIQLLGTSKTHGLQEARPREAGSIAAAPSAFSNAIITTIFSIAGVLAMAIGFQEAIQTDVRFAVGFMLITLSLAFGLGSVLLGSGGPLYRGLLYIRAIDPDASYREVILHMSNQLSRRDPFVLSPYII